MMHWLLISVLWSGFTEVSTVSERAYPARSLFDAAVHLETRDGLTLVMKQRDGLVIGELPLTRRPDRVTFSGPWETLLIWTADEQQAGRLTVWRPGSETWTVPYPVLDFAASHYADAFYCKVQTDRGPMVQVFRNHGGLLMEWFDRYGEDLFAKTRFSMAGDSVVLGPRPDLVGDRIEVLRLDNASITTLYLPLGMRPVRVCAVDHDTFYMLTENGVLLLMDDRELVWEQTAEDSIYTDLTVCVEGFYVLARSEIGFDVFDVYGNPVLDWLPEQLNILLPGMTLQDLDAKFEGLSLHLFPIGKSYPRLVFDDLDSHEPYLRMFTAGAPK